MEFTIKKIISIDNDAENYKRNMDELLLKRKDELKNEIKNMKEESEKDLNAKKKEILDSKIKEAEESVSRIKKESSDSAKRMEDIFKNKKNSIVDEAFKNIIVSSKEV